jgi:hypothetical protein
LHLIRIKFQRVAAAELTLDSTTGAISGTPTGTGSSAAFTIQLTDAAKDTSTFSFNIKVAADTKTTIQDTPADGHRIVTSISGTTVNVAYGITASQLTGTIESTDGSMQS